jgi:hypothetical protein
MASRFNRSCSPFSFLLTPGACKAPAKNINPSSAPRLALFVLFVTAASQLPAQMMLKPSQPGEPVTLLPSDLAILEAGQERKDLPCTVTQRKPDLGFDLRFHGGFDVTVPLQELAGDGQLLTVVFRVRPDDNPQHPSYFVQHFNVPVIEEDAKGEAMLQGAIDMGEGSYHVDWLMRDRDERLCSSSWDVAAALSPKDKPIPLFISKDQVAEMAPQPFVNDVPTAEQKKDENLSVKLLVNFAPQSAGSAALQRSDTDALVSILKTIERDPRVTRVSLVAFNLTEGRVVYRQESADQIDFPALGKALQTMKLGTVNIAKLNQKHSETDFLQNLISTEVGTPSHPDAVIFAGPKAMLDADVPQDDLRKMGDVDCPVFYMNYILNPQATPWKDSISHAIKTFKGVEYTISRPRDLWFSTSEMFSRILRSKRDKSLALAATGASR